MSWIAEEASEAFDFRWPIAVDNLTAGVTPIDIEIPIPADLEDFFSNVQSAGEDVRLTAADGATKITDWNFSQTDFAGRDVTIQIEQYTPPAAQSIFLIWLYWGNSAATDGQGTPTIGTTRNGVLSAACHSGRIVAANPETPAATTPRTSFSKTTLETILPWYDISGRLEGRCGLYNGRALREELEYVQLESLSAGVNQPSELDRTRIIFGGGQSEGRIRVYHTGGTDGEDRTLQLTAVTTEGRVIDSRARIQIRDTDET